MITYLLTSESLQLLVVQVNGKLRARIMVSAKDAEDKEKLEEYAKANEKIKSFTDGKEIVKVIVIPKTHLVNIVIR